jgi:hypothetical protein
MEAHMALSIKSICTLVGILPTGCQFGTFDPSVSLNCQPESSVIIDGTIFESDRLKSGLATLLYSVMVAPIETMMKVSLSVTHLSLRFPKRSPHLR